jgi:hypothetical protein
MAFGPLTPFPSPEGRGVPHPFPSPSLDKLGMTVRGYRIALRASSAPAESAASFA